MPEGLGIKLTVKGDAETARALESLARQSPAVAARAVNRTIGVAKKRVIRSISRATGINQRVIGGAKGRGYVKQVKASRRRGTGALVVLTEGVRFSQLKRNTLGHLKRKPGGAGVPFNAVMPTGHASLFERRPPMMRISQSGFHPKTRRKDLPIREVVVPTQPYADRAIRIHMRRVARTVYPQKVWEGLRKRIKPVR